MILLLFNQLWKNEIYPSQWNELFILPIFKSGSFNDPNNYRGIAIMSCLGKLCSVVINLRLYAWAEKHGKYQNGKEVSDRKKKDKKIVFKDEHLLVL